MYIQLQNGLLIRDLAEQDIPACMAIEAFRAIPEWEFFSHMTGSNLYAVAAEAEGKVLGFMLLTRNRRDIYIDDIAVAASARGRGVGLGLLTWLKNALPAFKRKAISLHVSETNNVARALYVKVGFSEASVSCFAYNDGSQANEMVFGERPKSGVMKLLDLVGGRCS